VTLPLHLLPTDALAGRGVGDVVVLDGPEGRHAATVRRTRVGEHLLLTDGAGLRVEAEVIAVGSGSLDLRVVSVTSDPEPSPRLVLVQALAKNDRDDQAIEAATECGVDEVVPWQASRSVVQWRGERGEKAWRKWDAVLVAATKQSRRTRRPVLAPGRHVGAARRPDRRRRRGLRAPRGRPDAARGGDAPGIR
jgi:16S rRNA (uracil1498-N3)-methyltransferase